MNRFITRFLTAVLVAFAALTAPVAAQCPNGICSADAAASVVIEKFLTLATSSNLAFGSHFANELTVTTAQTGTFARWAGQTDVGNSLSVSMVLPTTLARVGGGGLSPVDFACGTSSGRIGNSIFDVRFDPASGLSNFGPVGGAGEFNVDLGWAQGGPASNGCTIQINGRTPGTYIGIITATVAVL
jgi:hypothetical protein